MQHGHHNPPLAAPLSQKIQNIRLRRRIHRGERLIEQDHAGILQNQPGKQHPLKLTGGECRDHAITEPRHPHPRHRRIHQRCVRRTQSPKRPNPAPRPEDHQFPCRDRKMSVKSARLRQQRNIPRRRQPLNPPGGQRMQPRHRAQQRGFARPVRPSHRRKPRTEHGSDPLHRQPAALHQAHRVQPDHAAHHTPSQIAHTKAAASASRDANPALTERGFVIVTV